MGGLISTVALGIVSGGVITAILSPLVAKVTPIHGQRLTYGRLRAVVRGARGRWIAFLVSALVLLNVSGAQPAVYATGGAGVSGAINYATTHWQWAIYDNSLAQVHWGDYQPQFQCAEFAARSLASAGPLGPLTPSASDTVYANVIYNTATYNLKLVSGLYHFLLDTGIATDAGTSIASATLGSVVIYGNAQDGDFLHTAIVTDVSNTANPLLTAHNAAYLNYPIATQMYDEYGRQMPITHILNINYGGIASGAFQNSIGGVSGATLQMNAPAPYHGSTISSGIALSWQEVTGVQTYNVSLYDVNSRLIDGLSTANTSFSYDLSTAPFGVYDYVIQPESSSASFPAFTDEFTYGPSACLVSEPSSKAPREERAAHSQASVSSATNCGGGSGTGATSLAPTLSPAAVAITAAPGATPAMQTVTLTNNGTATYYWQLGKEPSWVTVVPNNGSISPGSWIKLAVYFWDDGSTPSSSPGTYSTTLQFFDTGGVYASLMLPVTAVETSVSKQWYFAEGYTGGSFTEYLTMANPGTSDANVTVQYLLGSGSPITHSYYVLAGTRSTINVNNTVGMGQNVSMVVTSDQPIIAERPMYFTYTGLSGYTIPGGSDVLGATSLGTQFDFGYLDTSPGHGTYLTILNPNDNGITATVQYFAASGGAPATIPHTIAANSRGTVNVNTEGLEPGSYSALVTLSSPGLVERPMYLVDGVTGNTGSANVVGVTQPLTSWYFAEGYTSATFSERYIFSNPSDSATAHATVTFFKSDGSTASATATLAPGQQQVVNANNVLGNGVNNSATVTSDQPILAERFMSFTYTGPVGRSNSSQIPGATDVLGATAPSYLFYFAEGYTGGSFGEYLTLENPDATTAHVTVTYLAQNIDTPTVVTYTVNPTSRYTVLTNQVMPSQSFSMAVTSDQPIVAERPMYFSYNNGQTGGSDVVGYRPVAPIASPPLNWNVQASVSPDPYNYDYLYSVSAASSNDVWAVGSSPECQPIIEHWDGSRWTIEPCTSVGPGMLYGVTAVSSTNVWAVGGYASDGLGLIEHWDGSRWSRVASPNPNPGGDPNVILRAVSALSASDIWAVGDFIDTSTHTSNTITEHWDGTSWTIISSPGSSTNSDPVELAALATISSSDIWAVGHSGAGQPVTEHWDGNSWTIVVSPTPNPTANYWLAGVAAAGSDDVWAVGSSSANGPLVEHWDGTSWSIVSTPPLSDHWSASLNAVAVVSASDVWVVGVHVYSAALIEHWDGSSWTVVPNVHYFNDALSAVTVVSPNDLWAVGTTSATNAVWTFTEHYGS